MENHKKGQKLWMRVGVIFATIAWVLLVIDKYWTRGTGAIPFDEMYPWSVYVVVTVAAVAFFFSLRARNKAVSAES